MTTYRDQFFEEKRLVPASNRLKDGTVPPTSSSLKGAMNGAGSSIRYILYSIIKSRNNLTTTVYVKKQLSSFYLFQNLQCQQNTRVLLSFSVGMSVYTPVHRRHIDNAARIKWGKIALVPNVNVK